MAGPLLSAGVTLAIPVALLALNVHLLATRAFLAWEYSRAGFPSASGIADAERLVLAVPSTAFVVGDLARGALAELSIGGEALYTPQEVAHLEDVRRLLGGVTDLGAAGVALVVASALLWIAGRLDGFPTALARGGGVTIAIVVAVGLAVGLAWPTFFVSFHEAFFPQGNWSFPATSGLIRLFPERFWFDTAVAIAMLSLAEGLAVLAIGRGLGRWRG